MQDIETYTCIISPHTHTYLNIGALIIRIGLGAPYSIMIMRVVKKDHGLDAYGNVTTLEQWGHLMMRVVVMMIAMTMMMIMVMMMMTALVMIMMRVMTLW